MLWRTFIIRRQRIRRMTRQRMTMPTSTFRWSLKLLRMIWRLWRQPPLWILILATPSARSWRLLIRFECQVMVCMSTLRMHALCAMSRRLSFYSGSVHGGGAFPTVWSQRLRCKRYVPHLLCVFRIDICEQAIDYFCVTADANEDLPPLSKNKSWSDYRMTSAEWKLIKLAFNCLKVRFHCALIFIISGLSCRLFLIATMSSRTRNWQHAREFCQC